MVLAQSLVHALEAALKNLTPSDYRIQVIMPVSGGDVSRAYRIATQHSQYFVKINNHANALPMFLAETAGLTLLRKATAAMHTPITLMTGHANGDAFLLLNWIDAGDKQRADAQEALGRLLATLHKKRAGNFGLTQDNYIGKLPQSNTPTDNWTTFFIEQRLQKQLAIAGRQLEGTGLQKRFELLFARLAELYPEEPPSLLHGDLWSGNYLIDRAGRPVFFDPAVYYGHREVDLAMTKLFGGFSARFYSAYQELFPLQSDWEARVNLWNLYPLLVHFNLFGGNYLNQIKACINPFV